MRLGEYFCVCACIECIWKYNTSVCLCVRSALHCGHMPSPPGLSLSVPLSLSVCALRASLQLNSREKKRAPSCCRHLPQRVMWMDSVSWMPWPSLALYGSQANPLQPFHKGTQVCGERLEGMGLVLDLRVLLYCVHTARLAILTEFCFESTRTWHMPQIVCSRYAGDPVVLLWSETEPCVVWWVCAHVCVCVWKWGLCMGG